MVNFLVCDDHEMIRYGTGLLLKNNFKPCQVDEAASGDETIEKVKSKTYDLVILDMNMPNTDSQQLIQAVRVISPDTQILILTMNKEQVYAKSYLNLGARGYLEKTTTNDEIVYAVQTLLRGHIYMSPTLKNDLVSSKKKTDFDNPFKALSSKELEVMAHLVKGLGITETANIMNLSNSTIATHKSRILVKLNLRSIHELIDLTKTYKLYS